MKLDPRDGRRAQKRRKRPPAPWAILDVDLGADPLPTALPAFAADAAMVIWRFDGAVIGEDWIAHDAAPTDAETFAAAARRGVGANLSRLLDVGLEDERAWTPETGATEAASADPFDPATRKALRETLRARRARPAQGTASIVICTKGRPTQLTDCLRAIANEIDSGREVVVVDNGPDAETEAVVRAVTGVRYVPEPAPGVNRARNTGLAAARGDVVVYVDDDVVPEPGWIEAMMRRFDDPDVVVVCGLVLPHALETDSQIGFQFDSGFGGMGCVPLRFDAAFLRGWRYATPVWEIGASANMAVSARHMRAMGWLDERLGPGAAGGCGDDSEFWHRALQTGRAVLYEPLAVVRHQHRADMASLKRQAYGYAMGHILAQLVQHAKHGDPRCLWEVYWRRPLFYAVSLLRVPDRWLRGKVDRTLIDQLRGYVAALTTIRRVLGQPPVQKTRLDRFASEEDSVDAA